MEAAVTATLRSKRLPNMFEIGAARDDMIATHKGVPARTKLVPMGGNATCLRKKIGKNLMVMPDANPNSTSDVARRYGMYCSLTVLFGPCCCVSEALPEDNTNALESMITARAHKQTERNAF